MAYADRHAFLNKNLILFSGMNTTAGSFSLLGSVVPEDAGVVKRLRAAGAIILGMTFFTILWNVVSNDSAAQHCRESQSIGIRPL